MSSYSARALHGHAVDTIGRRIISGQIAPGAVLDVDGLSIELNASRTVMREALRVLADKGLIAAKPRRGTYALDDSDWHRLDPDVMAWEFATGTLSAQRLEDFTELRRLLEPQVAALAALRRENADLALLDQALADMADANADTEAIVEADVRFHRALFAATHNVLIEQQGVLVAVGLQARDNHVHSHRISIKRGWDQHRAVADAIRAADARQAEEQMRSLIDAAARDVREIGPDTSDRPNNIPLQ
ncbi:GntR family galactonate operon transcriptional repressor [Mycobacterium frederiksbergense]|uniref:GntR family galactonate operon transcriptional repressor n=1 Tax=Mycolicibacterium frederiksbergense TaxID=117567 RepID=A0ABT6L669_9MYCO|nr:FCD domain-containing protein [Mycolicibacterium frederiksbergense]MDH6197830.1 GntR family galactonate operon transcriptional repressor [Mycolicibacterium frederiksbergense]